jgi:hypothetical protein
MIVCRIAIANTGVAISPTWSGSPGRPRDVEDRRAGAGLARQAMRQRLGRGNGAASCALAASKA